MHCNAVLPMHKKSIFQFALHGSRGRQAFKNNLENGKNMEYLLMIQGPVDVSGFNVPM